MLNALQLTKVQQLNYINYAFFWNDLRGDCVSAAARQVNQSNMSDATKDPVNPVTNHSISQRDDHTVLLGLGAAPVPDEKAFQTVLISLKSPFSLETQDRTCCDPHHSEKYSGSEPLNSAISPWCMWSIAQSSSSLYRAAILAGWKMCPADHTEKQRLSQRTILRRLYSTFATSCENKAI